MIACAKINLILNVKQRRPDGYHELDTIFYPLRNVADTLSWSDNEPGSGIRISCAHPGVPLDPEKNLCGKAVTAYAKAAGLPLPDCNITLTKVIPCAGGMGGGSSDCAAVLRFLQEKYHALTDVQLAQLALTLGADVPFFLHSVPARAKGVGEKLSPLSGIPEDLPILLAAPDFPVSARWAYRQWKPAAALPEENTEKLITALQSGDLVTAAQYIGNSLAAPAFRKFPLLALIRQSMMESGALCAELSGSGPSVFAMYQNAEALQKGSAFLSGRIPGIRILSNLSI